MRLFFVLAISIACVQSGFAQEKIEGAFGLKLGDKLDVNSDIVSKVDGSEGIYRVNPPNPLKGFNEYIVYVTPQTHTIYQIRAFAYFGFGAQAKKRHNSLRDILKEKYSKDEYKKRTRTSAAVVNPNVDGKFLVGGRTVSISWYSGKKVASVETLGRSTPRPRVLITYASEHVELRRIEYEAIYKNFEIDDAETTRSIL